MSDLNKLLIFLSQFDLTNSKIKQIVDYLGDNPSIKSFRKAKLDKVNILTTENLQKMLSFAEEEYVDTFLINQAAQGVKVVCKDDEDFPEKLYNIDDVPYILYYKGDLSLLKNPSLAVVGTRKPTNYGRYVTEKLVRDVAEAGIVIISGLAYGIDSIAHRKCLEVGGKTIAVLGGGFDKIYPSEHQSLADEIAQKGLLISEYRPKRVATKYTFPHRNRIVAGLCDSLLITEASFKSGTIHTKDFAIDYGKDVFAVPGNIDSENSALPNEMIKTGQGIVATSSKDILQSFGINELTSKKNVKSIAQNVSIDENQILSQLVDGAKTIDELIKNSSLNINIFNTCLTTLEISGLISRMPGGYITLN